MEYEEFAIRLLLDLFPEAEVQQLKSQFSDLIVILPGESLQFCVEIQTASIKDPAKQERLRDKYGYYTRTSGAAKIPIIVLAVDLQKKEAEVGMALTWEFGFPVIEKPFRFIPLIRENRDMILDTIKAADTTIHSLSQLSSRFLKTIKIKDESTEAYFCYFRDFSIDYRMKDHPKDENKFEVYLKGVDESLFPSDELDQSILDAFRKNYNATIRTSLFIFSSDLSNLQRLMSNHKCSSIYIRHLLFQDDIINPTIPTIELKGYSFFDNNNQFSEEVWLDAKITESCYKRQIKRFHNIGTMII